MIAWINANKLRNFGNLEVPGEGILFLELSHTNHRC